MVNYSDLTNGPAEVIQEYIDKDFLEHKYTPGLHTGVDVKTTSVYSMSPGVVKLIGNADGHPNIFVVADRNNAFNYCHMKSVAVEFYQSVQIGTYLGECDQFVHFEYLNVQESRWPFRIGTDTWYKHDPIDVLSEGYDSVVIPIVTKLGATNTPVRMFDTQPKHPVDDSTQYKEER